MSWIINRSWWCSTLSVQIHKAMVSEHVRWHVSCRVHWQVVVGCQKCCSCCFYPPRKVSKLGPTKANPYNEIGTCDVAFRDENGMFWYALHEITAEFWPSVVIGFVGPFIDRRNKAQAPFVLYRAWGWLAS